MTQSISTKVKKAKQASFSLAAASEAKRNKALFLIAKAIACSRELILKENQKDISEAKAAKIPEALIRRLKLDEAKLAEMLSGIKDLIALEDPIGRILARTELDTGLILEKVSVPIGVIGVIFESRPDALVQISCLAIKSGNAVMLKGGSEARRSNAIFFSLIAEAAGQAGISNLALQLLETREDVKEMLTLHSYIDLIIPRGSNRFVAHIMQSTKIPVLGHASGICHAYIDKDADIGKAIAITLDAKCQYPAVCNAIETLLVHRDIAREFLPKAAEKLKEKGVELRGCKRTKEIIPSVKGAAEEDWGAEYNDLILSIKIVDSIGEAIEHINTNGSHHTDTIVTQDDQAKRQFLAEVRPARRRHVSGRGPL